jgi:hypothetical protein
VIIDRTRVCEVLVGLPDVVVLGVEDVPDGVLLVHVAHGDDRPLCPSCGTPARVKDRPQVTLVDLPVFDRRTRLVCVARQLDGTFWGVSRQVDGTGVSPGR